MPGFCLAEYQGETNLAKLKDPRRSYPEQDVDPEEASVSVSINQEQAGLSQSTISLYLTALQRAKLVASQRIGAWTYDKRHKENIAALFKKLGDMI